LRKVDSIAERGKRGEKEGKGGTDKELDRGRRRRGVGKRGAEGEGRGKLFKGASSFLKS
jgi:hypothetical protein